MCYLSKVYFSKVASDMLMSAHELFAHFLESFVLAVVHKSFYICSSVEDTNVEDKRCIFVFYFLKKNNVDALMASANRYSSPGQ